MTNASMISFVGDQQSKQFNLDTNAFLERGKQWQLWASFMVVEHTVLLLRVLVLVISPVEPKCGTPQHGL